MRRLRLLAGLFVLGLFLLPGRAAFAGRQFLWVTNAYGNDVHVIDVEKLEVVKRIVVGPQPHGIAAAKDASVVFVALENFKGPVGELLWIDPKTYKILHRLPVGKKPNQIACTPDGRWVYVPCDDGLYWVIDAKSRKVVRKIRTGGRPHNTLCSADGKRMYLSPMGSPRRVTIVDVTAGHKVIGEIPYSNSVRPPALATDEKRHFQHVNGLVGFEVSDVGKKKVVARVRHDVEKELQKKATRCHGLAIRPDQQEIWSCNVDHKTVHVHDITKSDYPQTAVIPMIGRIYWLCFSPDSKYAFISVRSANQVCVVDCRTKKIIKHIKVGTTPKRNLVIVIPDGS